MGHFYKRATFLTRGQEISSPAGESISQLAEIESPGEKIFQPGERLYKGAISFRVTSSHACPLVVDRGMLLQGCSTE